MSHIQTGTVPTPDTLPVSRLQRFHNCRTPKPLQSSGIFLNRGPPQTGPRLWGGSKCHLARNWQGHTNCGTALGPVNTTRADGVASENPVRRGRGPGDRSLSLGWEAEPEGFGDSKVEGENEVFPSFRRNPKGRGQFFPFLRRSPLADTRYASLRASRTGKNWLPSPPSG